MDSFDRYVLEKHGNPSDILKELYDVNITYNSARKYLTGIRIHLKHKQELGKDRDAGEMEEVIIKADGSQTTTRMLLLSEEEKLDPVHIMELMGYDSLQWEVVSCKTRRNYWDVTVKNADKQPQKSTNHAFMVTITVKPIQKIITKDIVADVFKSLVPPKLDKVKYMSGGQLLELPIVDFHFGLMAWREETGEDYDLKIAEQLYKDTINDIISRINAYGLKIERIVFPIGQDFFNSDTITNTTTRGTILDSDSRWAKMYRKGVELLVWSIEQLRHIAPVDVIQIPGNHDKMLSYCALITLDAYYKNIDSVFVDISPKPRQYIQYGKCLIGFAHGADEKQKIKHLMQVEAPKMWGETKFREFHLGHIHHEEVEEIGGVIFRSIATMKRTDAWETEMGYVGSTHKCQAFVWDKEKGKVLTIDSVQEVKGE